jgi:cob(I)alamin adenosyltransferase
LDLNRNFATFGAHGSATRDHGSFDLEKIHAGLDEEEVDAANEKTAGLFDVGISQVRECDVTEAGKFRSRSDRPRHEASAPIDFVIGRNASSNARGGNVQVEGLFRDLVLRENRGEAAETGSLQGVDSHVEKGSVHALDDIGPSGAQHLVAPFETRSAEVVGSEVETLNEGAECTVEHDHSFLQGVEVELSRHRFQPYRSRFEQVLVPAVSDRIRGVWNCATSVARMSRAPVYTRDGDDGTTGLFYGGRVAKDSVLPRAYGMVDEAQAVLGVVRAEAGAGSEVESLLIPLMRDLWVLMTELATLPENRSKLEPGKTCVEPSMVTRLENVIDDLSSRFDPPTEFVVPGGNLVAAWLDVARTVVRRAEVQSLAAAPPPSHVVPYLNRLSDLLWTMARWQEGTSLAVRSV